MDCKSANDWHHANAPIIQLRGIYLLELLLSELTITIFVHHRKERPCLCSLIRVNYAITIQIKEASKFVLVEEAVSISINCLIHGRQAEFVEWIGKPHLRRTRCHVLRAGGALHKGRLPTSCHLQEI
jgi:hypothetical protein